MSETPARSTRRPDTVRLAYHGQRISAFDDDAIPDIQTTRLVAEPQADGTVVVVARPISLLSEEIPRANRGLRDAILAAAARDGYSVSHLAICPLTASLPQPLVPDNTCGRPVSTHVLQFVHDHAMGLIHLGNGVGRPAIIGELVRGYPGTTFAVMTATRKQAKTLQHRLRQIDVRVQLLTSARSPRQSARIVVGTFESLGDTIVEFEKRDVIIAYDAREALAERAQLPLLSPDLRGRLYGLLGGQQHLSPLEEDRLAATFGFDQVSVPAYGCRPVSVDVFFVGNDGTFVDAGNDDIVGLKRRGIWRHTSRNWRLAKTARAFAVGDVDTVMRLAPAVLENDAVRLPLRTVLLTDSVEHVVRLAERLKSWPIRVSRDFNGHGLQDRQLRLLQRGMERWLTGENLIATPDGLGEVQPGTFDAVIWAGAGPGLPPIPWSHLVCPCAESRRLVVVDVRDRHHPQLRRWSRQRRDEYAGAGWFDRPFNPEFSRILRFLEQRPR